MAQQRRVAKVDITDCLNTRVWLDDGSELVGIQTVSIGVEYLQFPHYVIRGEFYPTYPLPTQS